MMKEEFEKLVGIEISQKEYKEVEHVYTWHPAIKDKQDIAALYQQFGMIVIRGMAEVADACEELDREKQELTRKMNILKERQEYVNTGYMRVEKAVKELEDLFMTAETEGEYRDALNRLCDCEDAWVYETADVIVRKG